MAVSEAVVCNIALARTGHRSFIGSLSENTTESIVCNTLYADARDSLLAQLDWSFARRRASLAEVTVDARSGWDHVYALPADCLAVRYIYAGARSPSSEYRTKFQLEFESGIGRVLLTDDSAAELVYTARVTEVVRYPPHFVDVLGWKLAQELALALSVKPQVAMGIDGKYQACLALAMAADLNEAREDEQPESEFIRVR